LIEPGHSTAAATVRLLLPINIKAVPITTLSAVFTGAAHANFPANRNLGHVRSRGPERHYGADDDLLNVGDTFEAPAGPDGDALAIALNNVRASRLTLVCLDTPDKIFIKQRHLSSRRRGLRSRHVNLYQDPQPDPMKLSPGLSI